MKENTRLSDNLLGGRVMRLMAYLQQTNGPRYNEVLSVLETARKSHPLFNPENPTANAEPFFAGHSAVFEYIEIRHPDLYRRIQKSA